MVGKMAVEPGTLHVMHEFRRKQSEGNAWLGYLQYRNSVSGICIYFTRSAKRTGVRSRNSAMRKHVRVQSASKIKLQEFWGR